MHRLSSSLRFFIAIVIENLCNNYLLPVILFLTFSRHYYTIEIEIFYVMPVNEFIRHSLMNVYDSNNIRKKGTGI